MSTFNSSHQAGGFLPTASPPPLTETSTLPCPRSHPLKPGSQKESALIAYLDNRLLSISRRYEKRFQKDGDVDDLAPEHDVELRRRTEPENAAAFIETNGDVDHEEEEDEEEGGKGYTSFREMSGQLSEAVDVVWISGTRTYDL